MNRIFRHCTRSPFASILVLTGALACSAGPASDHSQGVGGAVGGGTNSGGMTSTLAGGANGTGGTSSLPSGGARSSGGTSAVTGGANGTGGVNATGGACTTVLPSSCGSNSCDAATPSDPQLTACGALGNVTMYSTSASNNGACGYGATNVMYYAAINVNLAPGDGLGQWQGGRICGQCMAVTVLTSQGLKSVVVRIMDKCPDGYCGIDLGGSAPAAVMGTDFGRYQGAWSAVPCAGHPEVFDGVPSIYVKDGSNGGWSAIQVRNPMTAVAAIDYQDENNGAISGTMALMTPSIENYFSVPTDVLAGSIIDLTVRYVDGTTATVTLTAAELGTPSTTYPLN